LSTIKPSIKLLLIDDHVMLLDGLKMLLKNEPGIDILAEATNADDALEALKSNPINFVITDINLPGMSGIELSKKIKQLYPGMKILVLSMFNEKSKVNEMISNGVNGYILKNTGKKELIDAIGKIWAGGLFFSDEIIETLMKSSASEEKQKDAILLTKREIEIVKMIGAELTNGEIAEKLFLSERTVETHRKNIFKKTGSKSVVGLMNYAYEHGMIVKNG
jgi:two-component system nitrate/nitrite response regulator NarL